jgi:DNA ligase (NAD+)
MFTGELARMTRAQAKETVIQQGGRVSDNVSQKTDFLVVGSNPGRAKTEGAGKHGTRTLSETEFLNLVR